MPSLSKFQYKCTIWSLAMKNQQNAGMMSHLYIYKSWKVSLHQAEACFAHHSIIMMATKSNDIVFYHVSQKWNQEVALWTFKDSLQRQQWQSLLITNNVPSWARNDFALPLRNTHVQRRVHLFMISRSFLTQKGFLFHSLLICWRLVSRSQNILSSLIKLSHTCYYHCGKLWLH